MKYETQWQQPQRQPAMAIVYILYQAFWRILKNLWPLVLIVIFRGRRSETEQDTTLALISIGFSLLALGVSWINYWFFKFYIESGEKLVIEKGLFRKQKISIPMQNIQAIHLNRGWLHRLLNLTELLIDSPGTKHAETRFTLHTQQAAELKSYIFDLKQQALTGDAEATEKTIIKDTTYQEETLLFGLDSSDLIRLGISANHFRAFLVLIAFAYGILQNVRQASETYYSEASHRMYGLFSGSSIKGFIFLAILVILVSILISFVQIIIRYANFKISRRDQGFAVKTGLLEVKEKVISLKKIQYVKWSASWLRTKMNLYELYFAVMGEAAREEMKVKIPVTKTAMLVPLTAHYGSSLKNTSNPVRLSSKYPAYVITRFLLIPAALLTVLSLWHIYFLWGLLMLAYIAISYRLFYKNAALFLNDELLHISKGRFGTEEYLLQWRKIQSVRLKQNIYQRKHNLATIVFATATGRITMPFLELADAGALCDIALYKIESQAGSI